MRLEDTIKSLQAPYERVLENGMTETVNITLSDVCFKPLDPVNDDCAVESFSQWFQQNQSAFEEVFIKVPGTFGINLTWKEHIYHCSQ